MVTQQLEENHVKFIKQLHNRRAKKFKKFNECLKGKCDGVVRKRGNRGGNEASPMQDDRSEPLEKTESNSITACDK